jgi:glycerol 3-phosphatase-2
VVGGTLQGSARPLAEIHDVALLDLDGVVYVGPDAVPGIPAVLAQARQRGMRLAFVTNNASRRPAAVARHLQELDIAAQPDEVVTSAQAAARYLADRLPAHARVLVVGTEALAEAWREQGLTAAWEAESGNDVVAAVVQGYSPETTWRMLAEGAVAIRRDALWIATNADPTVPSPRGPLPGNGSLVAALRHATGAQPVITGKPDPTMHRETLLRTGARTPLVVGDRLDTDIEGANAVGCASLLVLSGVTTAAELVGAPDRLRPSYIAADAGGLLEPHPEPQHRSDQEVVCGPWQVRQTDAGWQLACSGEASTDDELDALRAVCTAVWTADGASGSGAARVSAAPEDAAAAAVLRRLGLAEPES